MSDQHASADTREAEADDYEEMLETLDVAIEEARHKVEKGRVYDATNEGVRQGWIRALAYVVNIRRQVTADRDLEELTERIEKLEELREREKYA